MHCHRHFGLCYVEEINVTFLVIGVFHSGTVREGMQKAWVHAEQMELSQGFIKQNTLEKNTAHWVFLFPLKQFLIEKNCIQEYSCTEIPYIYQTILPSVPNGRKKTSLNTHKNINHLLHLSKFSLGRKWRKNLNQYWK